MEEWRDGKEYNFIDDRNEDIYVGERVKGVKAVVHTKQSNKIRSLSMNHLVGDIKKESNYKYFGPKIKNYRANWIKLCSLRPRANHTDRATAVCRRR
jgi:hypothetical protein